MRRAEARIGEIRKQFPSEDIFMQTLIQRQMTLDQIRNDARQDMAIAKLIETEIASKIAVKPEQVQNFYAKNPDQFKEDESVRASHILIAFPENADAKATAAAKVKADQVLNDVAFSLAPGAISDVVETQFGYHIIKVVEKKAGRTVPLEEVRPQVEQYLQNKNRDDETEAFVKSLRAKGKVEILI